MLLFNISLNIAFFVVQKCTCNGEDVQYSYKVVSDTKSDLFATSLATAQQMLVVGAPLGNYILPEPEVKVHPPQRSGFGYHLDVNEHFIVVSGSIPYSVFVYSSTHPYTLLRRIPVDTYVRDGKILDDNTIIIANNYDDIVVYKYNHGCSWSKHQNIILEDFYCEAYTSLAVSGYVLAVGYWDIHDGRVNIYSKVNDQYTYTTTLRPPKHVSYFGVSVAIEGQRLVVSSRKGYENILFTYELDSSRSKWVMSGRLMVTSPYDYSILNLQNNILAATVTDPHNNPEVCAYVYKLSKSSHTTNGNNNSVGDDSLFTWKKAATLKTNGVPMTYNQYHLAISVQQGLIFTGRVDVFGRGYGVVFVHDMNKEQGINIEH